MVFSQFSTEYNKLHKKKRGDWVFKCYLWYLRFSSFWKRGRAALPDPSQGWSRSHYSIWLHHITSLPGGEKSRIPFSCFSTRFPLTTHSKMPWEHREAWDITAKLPSALRPPPGIPITLVRHCFCVQRLSFFKGRSTLISSLQCLTQNPAHFRSSLNVSQSLQPTSRTERDYEAAGDCEIKFRQKRTKIPRKSAFQLLGRRGVRGEGAPNRCILSVLKKFILK